MWAFCWYVNHINTMTLLRFDLSSVAVEIMFEMYREKYFDLKRLSPPK